MFPMDEQLVTLYGKFIRKNEKLLLYIFFLLLYFYQQCLKYSGSSKCNMFCLPRNRFFTVETCMENVKLLLNLNLYS